MRVALKQGRPAGVPRPAKLPPPADVARTWSVAGLAGVPLLLIVVSCRSTPVAQPAALFGVGLPLVCVAGAFVQRHRGLLVGAQAQQFTWSVLLGGLLFLLGVVGAMWRSQARALLATLTGGAGVNTTVAMEPVLGGLADGLLIVIAWRVGRRLYGRTGLLDIQPWERGDEGMRMGRVRLVEGLWRDLVVGAVTVAVALGVLWARAATPLDHVAVSLLTLVALPLYLGGGVTLMSSLTGVARRSGWALEGLVVGERLPSPWSATTLRVALGGAGALAVLTASPLVGMLHAGLFWAGATVAGWLWPLLVLLATSLTSGLSLPPWMYWPQFAGRPRRPLTPGTTPPGDASTGGHLVLSLVLVFLLSWLVWWLLVKLLDRVPSMATIARERRGRALLRVWIAWLLSWWRRGGAVAAAEFAAYQARRSRQQSTHARERVTGLPPRAAIVALYHRMVARAEAAGWRRPPSQTPHEFARRLRDRSSGDNVVQDITEAFVEARYSRHEIQPQRVARMLRLWRRAARFGRPPR